MKRSKFVQKVLKSKSNTVFVTKEQVENALEVFEALGMRPPPLEIYTVTTMDGKSSGSLSDVYEWELEDAE